MDIQRITIHYFDVPLEEPFVTALRPVPELKRVLIEIEADNGLVGVGEGAPGPQVTGETQETTGTKIANMLGPSILGTNPLDIERRVKDLNEALAESPTAKAAIELALQDLRAKHADMPLYRMLGGNTSDPTMQAPKILSINSPEEMGAAAAAAVESGYGQCKIKLAGDADLDVSRVEAIDRETPDTMSLKVDANQAWNEKTARTVIRQIESVVDVVEQPVDEDRVEVLARLRRDFDVPIMPDESLWSASDAISLVKEGAGDAYNIKLMKAGGITEARRINAIAEANGCWTQIGSMLEGHIGTAAGIHFALAFENVRWNEMVGPFMTTAGITDLSFNEPQLRVDGPGIGVTIDRDTLADLTTKTVTLES